MFDYSSISKYINREYSIEHQYSSAELIDILENPPKPTVKMVKIYLIAALVAVAAVVVSAVPLPDEEVYDLEALVADEYVPEQELRADRQRRVTCDLLSFGDKVGHSACAANCLTMGKAGGRCEDGVCLCRKTTFKELWDKRFG